MSLIPESFGASTGAARHPSSGILWRARAWTRLAGAAFVISALYIAAPALAAAYPQRPIHMIVPLAPGGMTNLLGRFIAEKLDGVYDQPVILGNRPGASGHIGANLAARFQGMGITLVANTPAEARQFFTDEASKWSEVIKASGIRLD